MELAAGFWIRLGAIVLDSIIVGIPVTIIIWMFTGNSDHFLIDIILALYSLLIPVYFNGKTVGKHLCKIKIADYDLKQPPTLWMMVKRQLIFGIFIVLSCGIVFIIDIFFVIFREDKRALHDLFAGTTVIEDVAF